MFGNTNDINETLLDFKRNKCLISENKKAKSNLWYVCVLNNCTKTLVEMIDEEGNNRPDDRTNGTDDFIEWYRLNCKKLKTYCILS